jgi:hypothetical protein
MSLFKCDTEGGVVRVKTGCPEVVVINVENFAGSLMQEVPVTGYSLELSTNHQFLHTLDEFIYAFAFGDRIGELTLTGIAFTVPVCAGGPTERGTAAQRSITNQVKQENVYEFYLANRFSKSLRPTKIQIGGAGVNLIGFLTGMRMDVPNPQLPIVQWALRYNVVVDTTGATTSGGGGGTGGGGRGGGSGNTRPGPGQGRINPNNPSGWDTVDDFIDTFIDTAINVITETFLGDD